MPLDPTDSKLLKGFVLIAVLGVMLYFYPFDWPITSYQQRQISYEQSRSELEPKRTTYVNYYEEPAGNPFGLTREPDPKGSVSRRPIAELQTEYTQQIGELDKKIVAREQQSRMNFAPWTEVPQEYKQPGVYFAKKYDQIRIEIEKKCNNSNVDVLDKEIGFSKFQGDVRMTEERARELLRELYIAEKMITLCIQAKTSQEQYERQKGIKPEAFMRIISVAPEESVKTGPYMRKKNPKFNPKETNPKAEGFKKYLVDEFPAFIQEYPVNIQLQCDVNSYLGFLRSVRTQGQFMVIRNLEICSPFLKDSQKDTRNFALTDGKNKRDLDFKDTHIWVKISAAGMDFFDPETGKVSIDGAANPLGAGPINGLPPGASPAEPLGF